MKTLYALAFLLIASSSFAWDLPGAPFGITEAPKVTFGATAPSYLSMDLIPTTSVAFGSGINAPSYGFDFSYGIFLDSIVQATDGTVNVTPYGGLSAGLYLDAGDWINSNLNKSIIVKGSVGLVLPEFQGVVGGIFETFNFQDGSRQTLVDASIPLGLFSGAIAQLAKF